MRKRKIKKSVTTKKSSGKINHKITIVDDIKFHSQMESEFYIELKQQKEAGDVLDFEMQVEYILQEKFIIVDDEIIKGSHPDFNKIKRKTKAPTISAIKYIADFKITYADGHVVVIDTKGKSTADFELKKKMLLANYPSIDFRVIVKDYKGVLGVKNEWVDYYDFRKADNAAKKARKLAKLEKAKEMGDK